MLQVAQRLGDFEIIRFLGKGGMGEVYEAQQLHPPRRVALKVLGPSLAGNPEALDRFEREACVLAQLDHPGIVRVIVTGRDPVAYYTMQLVRGVSLVRLLRAAAAPMPSTTLKAPTPHEADPSTPTVDPSSPEPASDESDAHPMDGPLAEYRRDRFALAARVGVLAARRWLTLTDRVTSTATSSPAT
jgi:hypothetical protein